MWCVSLLVHLQELEQKKFSVQQKLECQKAALLTVQHDVEAVKTELSKEHEMREEHLKQVKYVV